jgi:hypothetical protein
MSIWSRVVPRPSRDRFAQRVLGELRRGGSPIEYTYDRETFSLAGSSKGERVFLANAYDDYCRVPFWKRGDCLRFYTQSFLTVGSAIPGDFQQAKDHILPRVRDRWFFEQLSLNSVGQNGKKWPYLPLADHLAYEVVYDTPHAVGSVTDDQLKQWGVPLAEALDIARTNLWKMSNEDFECVQPGLFASTWHDVHDASRLILHDLIWQLPVKGAHVAMIPHRDLLLVTGLEDAAGLEKMAELAEPLLEDKRCLTPVPVRLEGTKWRTLTAGELPPGCVKLANLITMHQAEEYQTQKQWLDKSNEATHTDVFVASVLAVQNKQTGRISTIGVWGDGVPTLLPRTDYVAFMTQNPESPVPKDRHVEWELVRQIAGELMEPTDLYPLRWHVKSFPTDEQIRALYKLGGG